MEQNLSFSKFGVLFYSCQFTTNHTYFEVTVLSLDKLLLFSSNFSSFLLLLPSINSFLLQTRSLHSLPLIFFLAPIIQLLCDKFLITSLKSLLSQFAAKHPYQIPLPLPHLFHCMFPIGKHVLYVELCLYM